MISKEKFCYIIKRLENYEKLQDKINDLFKELVDNTEQDFCNAGGICVGHETVVVDLLCEILEPGVSERDSFISWWIYETEFGKRPDFAYVILKDGTRVDLSSADKLYDFLVENMQSSAESAEMSEEWKDIKGYERIISSV